MKKVILYGVLLGVCVLAMKLAEYQLLVLDNAVELYGGFIALSFTILGIWLGYKLTRPKVQPPEPRTIEYPIDENKLKELGISKREFEILQLIAEGHSNKEIGEKLFVSTNTIKTHSSRLFVKLDASRRTQAVQKAKLLGLLP